MASNSVSRSLHDVGLAAWFGGTLANAVALNPAAGEAGTAKDAGAVSNAGWNRWTPVNAAAIGAHLVGSVGQLVGNRQRLAGQSGVGAMAAAKTSLTVVALALTGWSRIAGKKVAAEHDVAVADATTAHPDTPEPVAAAQRQLTVLQWAIPAVTGALVVVSALAGEQQRPARVTAGLLHRITG
jgi:hypothetical protein